MYVLQYNYSKGKDIKEYDNNSKQLNNNKGKAIMNAKQVNEQTGVSVEICNMLGDTIFYITKNGRIIEY